MLSMTSIASTISLQHRHRIRRAALFTGRDDRSSNNCRDQNGKEEARINVEMPIPERERSFPDARRCAPPSIATRHGSSCPTDPFGHQNVFDACSAMACGRFTRNATGPRSARAN
jgi:hypothetical protein